MKMFAPLNARQKVAYALLAALSLGAMGYAGARYSRPAPEIRIQPVEDPLPKKPSEVVVDIAGAVYRPGVYRLKGDQRVQDALALAGGAKPNADLEQLNLAAVLQDGTQLYIPLKGQATPEAQAEPVYQGKKTDSPYRSSRAKTASSKALAPGSININTASASELDRLPGIGPATAAKIIAYRKSHSGFKSVDELIQVKGIGPKKLAAMRKYVRL